MRDPVVTSAADGVFHVEGAGTNWQILIEGSHVTLIDAAWPKDFDLVARSLELVNRRPADVEVILLTHAHRDHLGTAAEFGRRHGTEVRSHVNEAAHARGDVIEEISKWALVRQLWRPSVMLFVANVVLHGGAKVERLPNVRTFDEGTALDVPGRPVPVSTPGHTSGHCAFHIPERGVLAAGDALVTVDLLRRRRILGPMPRVFDHDPKTSVDSLQRLAALDAHVVLPGHGEPFMGTPSEAVERALAAVAK
jgi:glyoxylase-like metal-dependent hydrolase (beta-lactamase superfamily II)